MHLRTYKGLTSKDEVEDDTNKLHHLDTSSPLLFTFHELEIAPKDNELQNEWHKGFLEAKGLKEAEGEFATNYLG